MNVEPINFALIGALAALCWVVATFISVPIGTIDATLGLQALVIFPALAGSATGLIAAGYVLVKGQRRK